MSNLIVSADAFENAFVPKVSRDGGRTFTHLKTHVDDLGAAHARGKDHLTEQMMSGHISAWKFPALFTGTAAVITGLVSLPIVSLMLMIACALCFYRKLSDDQARRKEIGSRIVVA